MTWLLSKPALFAGAVVVVLGLGVGWMKIRDNRIRREAVAAEKIQALEAELVFAKDSLVTVKARTDTVVQTIRVASQGYATQRLRVDTVTKREGIPDSMTVVPIAYVRAADSMAVVVQQLLVTMARERVASDSVITLQRLEIEQLKIQVNASRPSFQSKVTNMAVGGAIVLAAVYLLGKN